MTNIGFISCSLHRSRRVGGNSVHRSDLFQHQNTLWSHNFPLLHRWVPLEAKGWKTNKQTWKPNTSVNTLFKSLTDSVNIEKVKTFCLLLSHPPISTVLPAPSLSGQSTAPSWTCGQSSVQSDTNKNSKLLCFCYGQVIVKEITLKGLIKYSELNWTKCCTKMNWFQSKKCWLYLGNIWSTIPTNLFFFVADDQQLCPPLMAVLLTLLPGFITNGN